MSITRVRLASWSLSSRSCVLGGSLSKTIRILIASQTASEVYRGLLVREAAVLINLSFLKVRARLIWLHKLQLDRFNTP